MKNDGHCPDCGKLLELQQTPSGEKQVWVCKGCHQVYYRSIFSLEIFKTLDEIGA